MARPAQGDHTTGLAFVASILAALRQAEKTQTGQIVETSLYETAVWTQASDYAVTAVDKAPVRKRDREHMLAISANRFPCGDGKWIVFNMMPDAAYWPKICSAINLEHLIEDERFIDSSARYKLMPELIAYSMRLFLENLETNGAKFLIKRVLYGGQYYLWMKCLKTPRTGTRYVSRNRAPLNGQLHDG